MEKNKEEWSKGVSSRAGASNASCHIPFRLLWQNDIDSVAYQQQMLISHNLEAEKSKIRCQVRCLVRCASSFRWLNVLSTTSRGRSGRKFSGTSIKEGGDYRNTNPIQEGSISRSNRLPRAASPDTITLGLCFNIRIWGWVAYKHVAEESGKTSPRSEWIEETSHADIWGKSMSGIRKNKCHCAGETV